ncbi:coiled-coil domain-containing protein 125-like isoform X1 [Acipenser ruthenus]|uniref:coiled-coil domain-containing protein 125-like isoform X1 n=2 Tax=Acipenser ruthenus TaxID=7906 RepID=UPI002741A644|nr:coiled-coil domain-containing protein 125-like isoform X1 [Acipenser ruthenus]
MDTEMLRPLKIHPKCWRVQARMQSGEQDPQRQEEEREDDMAGGDLGYGLGRKPGGIYEKGVKPQNPDGLGLAPAARLRRVSSHGSASFKWTAYTALHTVFQKSLPQDKRPGYWRLNSEVSPDVMYDLSTEELKQRLQEVEEEAEILRSELEVTQRQLEGKYEALKILQSRAVFDKATTHTKTLLQKSEERNKVLEKDVNALQWEIAFNQVQFKNIEQSWKEKYQRVCSENETLNVTLEANASQLQELKLENSSLNQQHLELLAMLNVKEQKMFRESVPPSSSGVREGTALELAVLGACSCSVSGGEPCPCAKSAAASRTQVLQLKQELDTQRKWKEEAFVMADAFRIAFEQQLKRRTDQTLRLMEADPFLRKETSKAKKVNGEAGALTMGQKLKGMLGSSADCGKLEALDDPVEILRMLVDLLNDKEEALAHQRKVSYMLAHNAEKLEGHIKQMKGANPLGNADSAEESSTNQRCHEPQSQQHCPGTSCHKPDEDLHNVRGEL